MVEWHAQPTAPGYDRSGMADRPVCVLLPGFDGSGRLFAPFLAEPLPFDPRVVALPSDAPRDDDELVTWVTARLPADRPDALLAESFSGPIAIRICIAPAEAPDPSGPRRDLLALTIAAVARPFGSLAHPALFAWPPPAWVVRASSLAGDADASLVATLREAIAPLARRRTGARTRGPRRGRRRLPVARHGAHALDSRLMRSPAPSGARGRRTSFAPGSPGPSVDGPHMILQRRPRECLAAIERFLACARRWAECEQGLRSPGRLLAVWR